MSRLHEIFQLDQIVANIIALTSKYHIGLICHIEHMNGKVQHRRIFIEWSNFWALSNMDFL